MGTPAVITFKSTDLLNQQRQTIHLFRGLDGDPIMVLQQFAAVMEKAHGMVREYKSKAPHLNDLLEVKVETLAGLYIAENTTVFGMGVGVIPTNTQKFCEWRYVMDMGSGIVTVLNSEDRTCSPFDYLDHIHDDYQPEHRKALEQAIDKLGHFGFTVER